MTAIDMEVDAFLADSAESVQGKIYALGIGWNTLFANSFPMTHPRIAIGVTIHVPFTATNQNHTISVYLEEEDGQRHQLGVQPSPTGELEPAFELRTGFTLGRPPLLAQGDEQIVAMAMVIDQLQFTQPGMLAWVIEIDGEAMKRLPMRVAQPPQPLGLFR
ncbi:MAG: DUF6941 family protein [Leifsonia sp.]